MSDGNKTYVFGPVPSRRLGRSLGVDLVPYKTCSYDCTYCQIGRTTAKTRERKVYAPAREVISQVKARLETGAAPDVITISGSGEPTLHAGIGEIIRAVKDMTGIPVAVLTNGSLLSEPEVREALYAADVVAPNLDAGSAEVFEAINRPHPGVGFDEMVEGLKSFAARFQGCLLLEVFVLDKMNANELELERIARISNGLESCRVQLNTATRPAAEEFVRQVDEERLAKLARVFDPPAEVIAHFKSKRSAAGSSGPGEVLEMLARRPCTLEDIASGLDIRMVEAAKYVEDLLAGDKIMSSRQGDKAYYALAPGGR